MIAAGVFLSMSSSELQTLIMMSIMTISLYLHLKNRPYHHEPMNTLETQSHLVALVTLYTGMIYVTSSSSPYLSTLQHPPYSNPHWFFFSLLLLPNLLFLVSWLSQLRICLLRVLHQHTQGISPRLFQLLACESRAAFARKHAHVSQNKKEEAYI